MAHELPKSDVFERDRVRTVGHRMHMVVEFGETESTAHRTAVAHEVEVCCEYRQNAAVGAFVQPREPSIRRNGPIEHRLTARNLVHIEGISSATRANVARHRAR